MSRIGKLIVKIPLDVEVTYTNFELQIKGPQGNLNQRIPSLLKIEQDDRILLITPKLKTRTSSALHGLYRSLIYNMVIGVSKNFSTTLILHGVGYRGAVEKNKLILNLGYSHPIELQIPENISILIIKNTNLKLTSCNKSELGLFTSKIRSFRPPEPYKGKGIRYENEIIKRKVGKSGKK